MPNVTGTGTTFNLPNYAGELFTASPTQTPFLSLIGGLTGGLSTQNDEFPTGVTYDLPTAAQPAITETASLTAPAAEEIVRTQLSNVTQIFQEKISLSYAKMANSGKLSGINTAGAAANPPSELDFQVARKLEKIARDVEYTFLNGTYQKATSAAVANKTRGMISLCSGGTNIDASSAALSTALLKQLYKGVADAGAAFGHMVMFAGSKQKQALTALYESQLGYNVPAERNAAGMNVQHIETDFFMMDVVYDPFMPADTLLLADIAACAPVFQDVPGKGLLFLEALAKAGAAEEYQLYGQIGLDHGPAFLHGTITDLA